jgi:hypothetical protein
VISPLELVRTLMMVERGPDVSSNVLRRVREDVRVRGAQTLFRGLAPTLVMPARGRAAGTYVAAHSRAVRAAPRA